MQRPWHGCLLLLALAATGLGGGLGELPANRWVKVQHSQVGGRGWSGIVYVPQARGMLYAGNPNAWNVKTDLHTMARFRTDTSEWTDYAPAEPDPLAKPRGESFRGWNYAWGPLRYGIAPDGRKVPLADPAWGNQACYHPGRNAVIAFVRGETLEYDPVARRWTMVETKGRPQATTGSSLCYDPLNDEGVLANGGFSIEGYPRTTWAYDAAAKSWTPLKLGAPRVNAVRLPLQRLRGRLARLRWLAWKSIEFQVTGRDLDPRSRAESLLEEAGALAARLKQLPRGTPATRLVLEAADKLGAWRAGAAREPSPAALEKLYRGNLVPALEAVEEALAILAVMPPPRMNAELVYVPGHRLIVCFGGDGQDRAWGDTWVYHCQERRWEKRAPASHPRPGRAMAAACEPESGLVVHLIHTRKGPQTWAYDAGANAWSLLDIPGLDRTSPPPHWMAYDPAAGCLVAIATSPIHAGTPLTTYALRLDAASVKRLHAPPAPEVERLSIDGEYVLRDAATVAELKAWQDQMSEWADAVPPNTWVEAPAHGTGRPNWGRTWSSVVTDPGRRQLVYRDGGHGSYHGSVTDHYDIPTGRWFRSARREEPPWPHGSYFAWGRSFSLAPFCIHTYKYALFYNPLTRTLQRTNVKAPRRYDEPGRGVPLHDYDPDLGSWSEDFATIPSGGSPFTAPLVPGVPDGLLCVEAFTRYGVKDTASVWYRTAQGLRAWEDTGPLPRYHDCHEVCFFFDPKRRRVLYYGGGNPKPKKGKEAGRGRLFALAVDDADPKWAEIELSVRGADTLPVPSREVVYLPRHDVFLMVEGVGGTGGLDGPPAIWCLNPRENVLRTVPLGLSEAAESRLVHQGVSSGLAHDPGTGLCFYIAVTGMKPPPLWAFRYAPPGAMP
ncbi:MAG: hypothetical protein ACOC8A_00110 [bacterium]